MTSPKPLLGPYVPLIGAVLKDTIWKKLTVHTGSACCVCLVSWVLVVMKLFESRSDAQFIIVVYFSYLPEILCFIIQNHMFLLFCSLQPEKNSSSPKWNVVDVCYLSSTGAEEATCQAMATAV